MFSALYQHCFQEWDIQYQTDTRGNAYKAIFPALLRSSPQIRSLSPIFRLCTAIWTIICHALAFTLTGSVGSENPETVEYMIEVCLKYLRKRLKLAFNQLGISFHTLEILRSTAAAKLVQTVCARVRRTSINSFYTVLALQDLVVRKCHQPPHNINNIC